MTIEKKQQNIRDDKEWQEFEEEYINMLKESGRWEDREGTVEWLIETYGEDYVRRLHEEAVENDRLLAEQQQAEESYNIPKEYQEENREEERYEFVDYSKVTGEAIDELTMLDEQARKVSPYPELLENPIDITLRIAFISKVVKPKYYAPFISEVITSKGFAKIREGWLRE